MTKVVAITGASAGVGRAAAEAFARRGYRVGLIARGQHRLDEAAQDLARYGVKVTTFSADVADAGALEQAAEHIERELGPIDIWVNNAMATVFANVADTTAEEFERATAVTYLGMVNGVLAALRRMRRRGHGAIVNVGSALAYRSIPLQAAYCGAKHAAKGFTDSLRSELIHERSRIHLTMVHLPAMNTPQFDWALNKTGRKAQPMPPIYQPEVAARAIVFAATHRRREVWVGWPTVKAIIANKIAPGLLDVYLAWTGYSGQLTQEPADSCAPGNLYQPAANNVGAHGRFDARARAVSCEMITSRHRAAIGLGAVALATFALNKWLCHKMRRPKRLPPPAFSGGPIHLTPGAKRQDRTTSRR